MLEHLAHEEGISAGDAVQPLRVDGPLTDQIPHATLAEGGQRHRARARTPCHVAEERPHGMTDAKLVVADHADDQRAGLRDPAQHEPQQIDRALVGPMQVVEHENRWRRAQVVVHRGEDVVGLIASVED